MGFDWDLVYAYIQKFNETVPKSRSQLRGHGLSGSQKERIRSQLHLMLDLARNKDKMDSALFEKRRKSIEDTIEKIYHGAI